MTMHASPLSLSQQAVRGPAAFARGAALRPASWRTRLSGHRPELQARRPLRLPQAGGGGGGAPLGGRDPRLELQARRSLRLPQAAVRGGGGGDPPPDPSAAARSLVASPLYRWWLQGGVALVLFMLVDAGFSGDWVRIGAITTEQEAFARALAAPLGCFHLVCGATAAAVSARRGEAWAPRTAKVLAVGLLALIEVLLLPDEAAAGGSGGSSGR